MGHSRVALSLFTRKTLIVASVALLSLLLVMVLRQLGQILLVLFGAVLFAVLIDAAVRLIMRHVPLSRRWVLALVLVSGASLLGGGLYFLGPEVAEQFRQLGERLPSAAMQLYERIERYPWAELLLRQIPSPDRLLDGALMERLASLFSTAFGALTTLLLILFVGLYMAIDPNLYTRPVIALLPRDKRKRGREVLCEVGRALRRWLLGRLASMVMVGALMTLGLSLLGVPLEFSLGVLAGLFEFVPYVGPVLGALAPVLIALSESPRLAFYVLLLAWGIQLLETYLITPLVEEYAVSIPPGFNLIVQVFAAVLAGFLGLLLATPLVVTVTVVVQMLYLQDVLGDSPTLLGDHEE